MINGKRVLAVIPARSGSKGLPGKNIIELCGKPLIAWTIERAKQSAFIDEIIVSTDSKEIAEIAIRFGANCPFIRPEQLATDFATSYSVVEHCLNFCENIQGRSFQYVVLLEPTSPLREFSDIDDAIALLDSPVADFNAVISVGEITEHPAIVKRISDGYVSAFCPEMMAATRRQDLEPAYFPFGAVYAIKTESLLDFKSFYPEKCGAILLKSFQCLEIDDEFDLMCVEAIMKKVWSLN